MTCTLYKGSIIVIMHIAILCFYFYLVESSNVNFQIVKFENCNKTQGIIQYRGNITTEKNSRQYLSHELNTPIPWDDKLGLHCKIDTKIAGENFIELFSIREKNFCKAGQMYMGEFWYDIMLQTGHPNPRECPLMPGRYRVNHMELNFNKLTLQTFPFGRLRFTFRAVDNKNLNAYMFCLVVEVENLVN